MTYVWPPHTPFKQKVRISQVLWALKDQGDIVGPGATRHLVDRLRPQDPTVELTPGFRITMREMAGGRYGNLIERTIVGKDTVAIRLLAEEMPERYFDANQAELAQEPGGVDVDDLDEPEIAFDGTPELPELTQPAESVHSACETDHFDLVAAGLAAELDELRQPLATIERPSASDRVAVGQGKDELLRTIMKLMGDLAVLVAGEPDKAMADIEARDRLADSIERAERMRRRAVAAEDRAETLAKEVRGLRRQLLAQEGMMSRMESNLNAMLAGERAPDDRDMRALQKLISERPNDRRGGSRLAYTVGG